MICVFFAEYAFGRKYAQNVSVNFMYKAKEITYNT